MSEKIKGKEAIGSKLRYKSVLKVCEGVVEEGVQKNLTFSDKLWYDPDMSTVEVEIERMKKVLGAKPDVFMTFTFRYEVSPEKAMSMVRQYLKEICSNKFHRNQEEVNSDTTEKVEGLRRHFRCFSYGGIQRARMSGSGRGYFHIHVSGTFEGNRPRLFEKLWVKQAKRDHKKRIELIEKESKEGKGALTIKEHLFLRKGRIGLCGHPIERKWKGDLRIEPGGYGNYAYMASKHTFMSEDMICYGRGRCRRACKGDLARPEVYQG